MATENVLLNDCSDRQLLEDLVDPVEEGVTIIDVFLELGSALVSETHAAIDLAVFMCSSKQDEVFGIFDL